MQRDGVIDMGVCYNLGDIDPNSKKRAGYIVACIGKWFKDNEEHAKWAEILPRAEVLLNPFQEPVAVWLRAETSREHVIVTVTDKVKRPLDVYVREWKG